MPLLPLQAVKAGCGLAVAHGHGCFYAKLSDGPHPRWSAPCFVRMEGLDWGLVAGVDDLEGLVGFLSKEGKWEGSRGAFSVYAVVILDWKSGVATGLEGCWWSGACWL